MVNIFFIEISEAKKRIKNDIIIFGVYMGELKIEPNMFLLDRSNPIVKYKVKGIESLSFIDKTKMDMNPWIIIEVGDINPMEFIGKTLESVVI